MIPFRLETFISRHVTGREESLFRADLEANRRELAERIGGRSVLVIGGAGSIGSSYIRALLPLRPARLVVVDTNENGLTELTRDLRSRRGLPVPVDYLTYPINLGDTVFEKMLLREGPFDIVANFAAHKHVRSEKDPYAIEAMVENNVLKARRLLELLLQSPPEHFFCVSTDKAANPVNVMGATKKLMEEVIMAYAAELPVTTARFANVAFSNGSLPAGFLERLMKGQPLSAPSDVRRYFVSPEESGEICLLACMLGRPGEIFFPRLEEADMKTFSDIALNLLTELGYEPLLCSSEEAAREAMSDCIGTRRWPIYCFCSDTSGEKAFEEFHTGEEEVDWERFAALGLICNAPRRPLAEVSAWCESLSNFFKRETVTKADIVALLSELIPSFEHLETGRSLDSRM
jgi:FlaA1/EpsC-like NDP-sugar epimerase